MSDAQAAPATTQTPGGEPVVAATPAAPAPAAAATPAVAPAAPAATPAPAPAAEPTAEEAAAKAAADKAAEDAKEKPAGAPEKYGDFTLPEGFKMDEPTTGKFTEWAKANNLTQEAAQDAVDMAAQMQQQTLDDLQAGIEAQSEKWAADTKVDKEFGGDKFDENLAVALKARDQFGTPELTNFLNESKLGNHPEVIRYFYRVGQAISQDGFVPGRAGAPTGDPAKSFYPSMQS
jgi:hypothetical protein